MIGPLQLLVIGFDEDKYARDIILEIKNLRKEKTIRLFDLLYLFKHEDGTIDAKEVSDLQAEEQREFGTLVKSLLGLSAMDMEHIDADDVADSLATREDEAGLSESEIQHLAGQIPDGSSAIIVIFEHTWARGIKEAMIQTGGYVRAQGMIDPDTLKTATNELAAVLEAINKTETVSMEKMAAVLAEAKAQEEETKARAAEVVVEAEAMEAAAMVALAAAEQIAEESERATAEAEAREEAARQHLAEVTAEAEAMEDAAFAQAEAVRRSAQRQEEQAMAQAEEAVKKAEEIEAEAVLRAMNAMIAAKVIEKKAAHEALSAIIDADVIDASAARRAARALAR